MTDAPQDRLALGNQKLAEHQAEREARSLDYATDQLIKTSGWLTASLLAINGGGALALFNVIDRVSSPVLPASMFGTGIFFTLLNAVAIQGLAAVLSTPLEMQLAYWRRVSKTGQRDIDEEKALRRPIERWRRLGFVAPTFGWIAGLIFFAGAFSMTLQLSHRGQVNATRCDALQNDMLSPKPQRATSRELFVALGCKPD